ncbi:MAG: hypothetical protein RR677_10560 [Acinetobacter sp.]
MSCTELAYRRSNQLGATEVATVQLTITNLKPKIKRKEVQA